MVLIWRSPIILSVKVFKKRHTLKLHMPRSIRNLHRRIPKPGNYSPTLGWGDGCFGLEEAAFLRKWSCSFFFFYMELLCGW